MIWLLALVALVLIWFAAGAVLRSQGSRAVCEGRDRRSVSRSIVAVGGEVEVDLELWPPVDLGEIPERDLVLVLDRSSSMGSGPASRLGAAVRAARKFLDRCPDRLRVGLVTFNHAAERRCTIGPAGAVAGRLGGLRGEGATAIDLALDRSREELLEHGRPGVAKTVFLLSDGASDPASAEAAAESLRRAVPEVEVLAAALGEGIDRVLLARIAGGEDNLVAVESDLDVDNLFAFLARKIAGSCALALAADEGARAPRPFRLLDVRPAADVSPDSTSTATRLGWGVAVLDPEPVRLRYRLSAECPGWHPVAADLAGNWSMPDGDQRGLRLTGGPRVLVLPPLLTWAWPILNPLLFLVLGERFCAREAAAVSNPETGIAALPSPTLPGPLPAVEAEPYRPELQPALVVGLGETGEEILCRLRHRLGDRGVSGDRVACRLVDQTDGRQPCSHGGAVVLEHERLELAHDFYPYLEGLRRIGPPASRAWLPWQEWLSSSRPATSAAEPDRRRARLTAVLETGKLDATLLPAVEAEVAREGAVFVVGSVDDPVATGLLGEVLHVAAGAGARTTLMLAVGSESRQRDRAALERELSRWLLVRGDDVISDRVEPPAVASRLIDRVVVVLPAAGSEGGAQSAAEALYAMLAWPAVTSKVPPATVDGDRAFVSRMRLETVVWPQEHLWRWLRDRTLAQEVVAGMLEWSIERSEAAPADEATVTRWVSAFWSAAETRRPASLLIREAPGLLQSGAIHSALLGLLPHDAPEHEQVAFHRAERRRFLGYLDDWCRRFIAGEGRSGRWSLAAFEAAVARLESDHARLVTMAEELSGHSTLSALGELGADLFNDQRLVLERVRSTAAAWRNRWILAPNSVAKRLVEDFVRSEHALGVMVDLEPLRQRADSWAAEHGAMIRERLAFEPRVDLETGHCQLLAWIGDRTLSPEDIAIDTLRAELDRFRGTLDDNWSVSQPARPGTSGHDTLRLGARSLAVFPDITGALDETDPGYAGALTTEHVELRQALAVVEHRERDLPFVWPEESNAQRLGNWLRQPPIEREPVHWSPRVVHLLRDPEMVLDLFAELAGGRLERDGEVWALRRRGRAWPIAEVATDVPPAEALERFEGMVRQVVVRGVSLDGEPLPRDKAASWETDPAAAVAGVEQHLVVRAAVSSPGWLAWRDVIESLVLENNHRSGADRSALIG